MLGKEENTVGLVAVDPVVLDELVAAALADADANEVSPPLTPGAAWSPERVSWLRRMHEERRAGLDGPLAEATWAITYQGRMVGQTRLCRTADPDVYVTGIWLTRTVRCHGVGRRAIALTLDQARRVGAREVRATTTSTNIAAQRLLRRLGFTLLPGSDRDAIDAVKILGTDVDVT